MLLCHAKCVFTKEERAEILRRSEVDSDPPVTIRALSEEFQVPETIMRSTLHYARRDRVLRERTR